MKSALILSSTILLVLNCSIQKIALNTTTGLVEYGIDAIYAEPDLKIAEQAVASNLKLLEGFHLADKNNKKLLLMAGGYGIAPLVFLAEEAMKVGCRVDLVQGVRTGALASPKEMMPEGAELTVMTEDASLGLKGRITDCPNKLVAEADQVFACGPMPMYRT